MARLSVVLPAVVGLLSGVASTLIATQFSKRPPVSAASAEDEPSQPVSSEPEQIAARQAGKALVEAAVAATREASSSPATRPASSPEEQASQALSDYHRRIDEHKHIRPDPLWSSVAQGAISNELKSLETKAGFSLLNVDCRESSCLAEVKWQTFAAAHQGYGELLRARYDGLNCASEIHMPASAGSGPLMATLVLEKCR